MATIRLIVTEKDPGAWWTDIFLQRGGQQEVNLTQGQAAVQFAIPTED